MHISDKNFSGMTDLIIYLISLGYSFSYIMDTIYGEDRKELYLENEP